MGRMLGLIGVGLFVAAVPLAAAECEVQLPAGTTRYQGECKAGLAHGHGRAVVPSRVDPDGYYEGEFVLGRLHGKAVYHFGNGRHTSTEYFRDGVPIPASDNPESQAEMEAWNQALTRNSIPEYQIFINNWPESSHLAEARERIARLAHQPYYAPIQQADTAEAYRSFIEAWPKAPQVNDARRRIAELAFEPTRRTDTVAAYIKFIAEAPENPFVDAARQRISELITPDLRAAESAYECETARELDGQLAQAGSPRIFDYAACLDAREFHSVLTMDSPRALYLAGVKYLANRDTLKAKWVFESIMERYPADPMALEAATRLANLHELEALENAREAAAEREIRARQVIDQADQEAAARIREAQDEADLRIQRANEDAALIRDDAEVLLWRLERERAAAEYRARRERARREWERAWGRDAAREPPRREPPARQPPPQKPPVTEPPPRKPPTPEPVPPKPPAPEPVPTKPPARLPPVQNWKAHSACVKCVKGCASRPADRQHACSEDCKKLYGECRAP